ncbi:Oxysterol-binding protein 1 [Fasciola gigantica]|uniref:Oxysterol-binding protein n=1 Tax=Fasciola gigantica TaxID=46835 RepID=A0A504XP16_FASGI|nr:Oxysterol-binding protein 1 [Fasciola gigantica]
MDSKPPDSLRGFLFKWTNYIKGYQKRWFILQNGLLSYYRNQAEMAHTCRGTINLANATVASTGSTTFLISNSSTQTFHLKAACESEQKMWVSVLLTAKSKALALRKYGKLFCSFLRVIFRISVNLERRLSDDSDVYTEGDDDDVEYKNSSMSADDAMRLVNQLLAKMEQHLVDLQRHQETLGHKGDDLQRSLADLETARDPTEATQRFSVVRERSTVFGVASLAMVNACAEFASSGRRQTHRWRRIFNSQRERCALLEQMIEELAKQLRQLETLVKQNNLHTSLQLSTGGTSDRTESGMASSSHLTGRSDSASMMSTSLGDENNGIPSVNDVAYEYESDVYGSDDDEDDAENQMKVQKTRKPLREARVIQPRMRRHDSRSATLVPSGDRSSDRKSDLNSELSQAQNETRNTDTTLVPTRSLSRPRRTTIPPRPNYSLNLWSIMKNCIGKELTKIPMPVNFSEPLSMLQRLTEDFEYSSCLDRAAQCQDTLEQMAHVAAFTVSAYATTAVRVNKPFNPLLGETYECDRTDDRGWRSLAEQVSHHPPKCALHCESNAWYCWFEFSMNTKFRGKYLQINPVGTCHLVFRNTGHHYTWQKIPLTVHNIIVGRLWIDNSGEMDIINHSTGEKCHLSYKAYSYFSSETPRRVTGAITDKSGAVRYVLNGTWDESMEYAPVVTTRQPRNGKPILETGPARIAWQRNPLPPDSERMHYFTLFALQLNEEEPGVCPTDCRLRPDQRLMEVGKWDEANREKVVLEEKQRHRRRQIAASLAAKTLGLPDAASGHSDVNPSRRGSVAQSDISALTPSVVSSFLDQADSAHRPMWFERQFDQDTGEAIFAFNGKYWEKKVIQDWSMCPDIY